MENKDAPQAVLQFVRDEAQTAKELEVQNPSLADDTNLMPALEDALSAYYFNDATATVVEVTRAVERVTETASFAAYQATQTIEATLNHATGTVSAIERATYMAAWATDMACWAAAGAGCTATAPPSVTPTPKPSLTPQPSQPITPAPSGDAISKLVLSPSPPPPPGTPTLAAQPDSEASQRQGLVITLATGVISLIIVVYLVVRRYRRVDVEEDEAELEGGEQGEDEE